jgi:hypothetical protein
MQPKFAAAANGAAIFPLALFTPTFPGRALTASSTAADWMITGPEELLYKQLSTSWAPGRVECVQQVQRRCPWERATIASPYIRRRKSNSVNRTIPAPRRRCQIILPLSTRYSPPQLSAGSFPGGFRTTAPDACGIVSHGAVIRPLHRSLDSKHLDLSGRWRLLIPAGACCARWEV